MFEINDKKLDYGNTEKFWNEIGSEVRRIIVPKFIMDVDVDVFRRQIKLIDEGRTRPDFTLFVSRDDDALAVSRLLWGSTDRVGAIDPGALHGGARSPHHERGIRVPDQRVVQVDALDGRIRARRAEAGSRAAGLAG